MVCYGPSRGCRNCRARKIKVRTPQVLLLSTSMPAIHRGLHGSSLFSPSDSMPSVRRGQAHLWSMHEIQEDMSGLRQIGWGRLS